MRIWNVARRGGPVNRLRPPRRAGHLDPGGTHIGDGLGAGLRCDTGGQVQQHAGGETRLDGVGGGRHHAVVRGDAHDVDFVDVALAQPVRQRGAGFVGALEAAVRRRVPALGEHGLDGGGVELRVEVGARRADHTVRRPGRREVGVVGEVLAGIDVEVLGRDDVGVVARGGQIFTDRAGHRLAADHFEGAALAEVVLHVDDEERPHAPNLTTRFWPRSGVHPPADAPSAVGDRTWHAAAGFPRRSADRSRPAPGRPACAA